VEAMTDTDEKLCERLRSFRINLGDGIPTPFDITSEAAARIEVLGADRTVRISGPDILPYRFKCCRPDHIGVHDEHVLASDYDEAMKHWDECEDAHSIVSTENKSLRAQLAEARAEVATQEQAIAVNVREYLALEAELEESKEQRQALGTECQGLMNDNEELYKRTTAVEKDAERYRWLRSREALKISYSEPEFESLFHGYTRLHGMGGNLDAAIDKALSHDREEAK
jgi:hypothetical protein